MLTLPSDYAVPGYMWPGFIWPAEPFVTQSQAPAIQTITPTQVVGDGTALDLGTLLATPAGTILQFANSGLEILYVQAQAAGETVQVDMGAMILGQPVGNFPAVNLASGHLYAFGPFHSVVDQAGTTTVQVTLSTTSNIAVALLRNVGLF